MFSSVFMDFGDVFKFKGRGFIIPQLRGERRYLTSRERGGGEKFGIFNILESLGKIKGHVKKFFAQIR